MDKEVEKAMAVMLANVMGNISTICAEVAIGKKLKGLVTDPEQIRKWDETLAEAERVKAEALARLGEMFQEMFVFKSIEEMIKTEMERTHDKDTVQKSDSDNR